MSRSLGIRSRLLLGAMAGAGVVIAHVVAFRIAVAHDAERQAFLLSTGHGWWPVILSVALAGLVAGLIRVVLRRQPPPGRSSSASVFVHAVARLVPLQVAGFTVLEAAERMVAGSGVGHLFQEPVFVIGLALQVAVAVAAAVLVAMVTRAVRALMSLLLRPLRAPVRDRFRPALPDVPPRMRVLAGGATLRAPPLAA
jgi:hypothetical protein